MSNDNKNQSKSRPSTFANTVDKATGSPSAAGSDDEGAELEALPKEARAMILKPSQEQINALMSNSDFEFAPQVYSIKPGEMIEGFLEGNGPQADFTQIDPMTRAEVTRAVDTWILRHPLSGYRISILSSVQLDKKLPPFAPGRDGVESLVTIFRGEDIKTAKNFKVTNYTVAGPKRADGKLRSWVQAPRVIEINAVETRTIDGHPDSPQLGAGAMPSAAHGGEDAAA